MTYDDIAARVEHCRPRVAAELARPHAEEALLAHVVADLHDGGVLDLLAMALGLSGTFERAVLWGADVAGESDFLPLASALHVVVPSAGRAVVLDAEPDLVVITNQDIGAVDATVGRPGHAVARARRGEPVPEAHLVGVADTLLRHNIPLDLDDVRRHLAPARLAAVALTLADSLERVAHGFAVGAPSNDLLRPDRDDLAAWAASAQAVLTVTEESPAPVQLRVVTWLDLARRLQPFGAGASAVRRIRAHPVLASTRIRLG